jgi:hypothetical protein
MQLATVQVWQRWYSCWKDRREVFAVRSHAASLVAVTFCSPDWNRCPRGPSFDRGKKIKLHSARVWQNGDLLFCNFSWTSTERCACRISVRASLTQHYGPRFLPCTLDQPKSFSGGPAQFLPELGVFPAAHTATFSTSVARGQLPLRTVASFLNTPHVCTRLLSAGTREEWTRHYLLAPHIRCSA